VTVLGIEVVHLEDKFHSGGGLPLVSVTVVRPRSCSDVDLVSLQCQVRVLRPALIAYQAEAEHARIEVSCCSEVRREELEAKSHGHDPRLPPRHPRGVGRVGQGSVYGDGTRLSARRPSC